MRRKCEIFIVISVFDRKRVVASHTKDRSGKHNRNRTDSSFLPLMWRNSINKEERLVVYRNSVGTIFYLG